MNFSCTKKVLDKLKKYKSIENSKAEIGIWNWYVDQINLERKNYFLFTNSKTLFSFILYAGTKRELENIEFLFEEKLKEMIIREIGSNSKYIENALKESNSHKFMKTDSRSVLGSMNDFKQQIRVQLWHKGELAQTYDLINHYINEVPMGAINYNSPSTEMKHELE
jgi:hypothetical protein